MNARPFKCRYGDPRCVDDPCPAGIRWLCEIRDTDGSPKGTDPKALDGEAATAGAAEGGIAQPLPQPLSEG